MGFFTRTKYIINSNINAALDKAEDPEKMIKLMAREMEDTLVELKSSLAEKISLKKKIQRDEVYNSDKVAQWTLRAQTAVTKKRDDLAKDALQVKKQFENDLIYLHKEEEHTQQIISETQANVVKLEEKLKEVLQKQKILIHRAAHAVETKRANTLVGETDSNKAILRFDQLENRIERMEAESDIQIQNKPDLESQLMSLEKAEELEKELVQLKAKMKKGNSSEKTGEKDTVQQA
ncbi:MAG: PspA/IM30 family protein [Spirochaetaceae bacterium]|jgi:phage shock protein A|nr:PspA/IM30 family protein [Spirochaetaceae bacterium]